MYLRGTAVGELFSEQTVNRSIHRSLISGIGVEIRRSRPRGGGKKLYELARKGVEIEREARPIHINAIKVEKVALPDCEFILECSKGTYVRSLCHDVGARLGCGGTLAALRRVRSGSFDIKDAVTIDYLKELEVEQFKMLLAEKLSTFAGFGGR